MPGRLTEEELARMVVEEVKEDPQKRSGMKASLDGADADKIVDGIMQRALTEKKILENFTRININAAKLKDELLKQL
jgi:hypothetical protein